MHRAALFLLLFTAGSGASAGDPAEDCKELGVPNAYLAQMFCTELRALLPPGASRGLDETDPALPDGADWSGIGLLRDAYRADPRKTLELIRRIKDAGGLTSG